MSGSRPSAGGHPARPRKRITTPLTARQVQSLRCGDRVLISGTVYAARDAAHQRMADLLARGQALPFPPRGAVIYYVGPSPARPGLVIGAAGPTTSERMDDFTPQLLAAGLKGMIGKGRRSPAVRRAMAEHGAVYFGAVGGAGAVLAGHVTAVEVVAWPELGPEALRKLTVRDFPVTVIDDLHGGDLYRNGREAYRLRRGTGNG